VREGDEVPPLLRTTVGLLHRGRDAQHEVRREHLRTRFQASPRRVSAREWHLTSGGRGGYLLSTKPKEDDRAPEPR